MELTVDDIRSMVGGYVLELVGKEKEIAQLKKRIEELEKPAQAQLRALEVMKKENEA